MKKIFLCVITLLTAFLLALPTHAAQSASMSVSASSGTAYRGDTITVSVSTSAVENCTSGGFMFSFDTSVFEYVGGSASVSGFTAGVSGAAGNVAGYFMNGKATVQGTLFSITLRVKDTAPVGTYGISGTPSLTAEDGSVSCGVSGTSVTIVCNHKYGDWAKVDDTNHGKTCEYCNDVKKEAHAWDKGTVIKEASCKEGGQIKHTCATCSATKTVDTDKTTTHTYGTWTKADDTNHKHTCSVCQKEETAKHTWDAGKVTKQPDCKNTGTKTYTCTACNATKTEDIDKTTTHTYGSWTKVDDTNHKHTCTVCKNEETTTHTWNSGVVTKQATCIDTGVKTFTCTGCSTTKTEEIAKRNTHTYSNGCDSSCNVCGATRVTSHDYPTTWESDKTNHWHECTVCGNEKDKVAHTPGAEATETTAQVCTVCDYVIKAALGHKHNYAEEWSTDENGHWYACSGCEEQDSYTAHDFENACDKDCSICGFTREVEHKYEEAWTTDENNHWHVCLNCGLKQDESVHEPGAEATATTAQTCTICGYETAPALGEPESSVGSDEPTDNENSNIPWLFIAIGAGAVVIIAGAVIVIKKRK